MTEVQFIDSEDVIHMFTELNFYECYECYPRSGFSCGVSSQRCLSVGGLGLLGRVLDLRQMIEINDRTQFT